MALLMIAELLILLVVLILSIYYVFLLPPRHPQNIPAIPFWVTLLPFFQDVDQSETFKRYIEQPLRKHGAVKIFFGAQWNVLVHKPAYLAEIFRQEDVYQKSGNQKKIPHSVLASFLGDNIISAHGEDWKLYQGVIKPGLQKSFDPAPIIEHAGLLTDLIRRAKDAAGQKGIPVQELMQRYTIANTTKVLLQMDVPTLASDNVYLHTLQTALKREIFKPIFMNFPILDRLPIPSRQRARKLAAHFTDELVAGLVGASGFHHAADEKASTGFADPDALGPRLLAARDAGVLTEKQFRDNLTVSFVASQENPQLLLISMLYLLAKHPDVQDQLHAEIMATNTATPTAELLTDMPLLTSVIYESLRLFPPIGQLINRRASQPVLLGNDIYIPEGTYLGYNCYSTNRDPAIYGADADVFRPARWGESLTDIHRSYRQRKARAELISFHGGRRACLGEKFALLEMKVSLFVLVGSGLRWRLDPSWADRRTPAGPLYPRALRLIFDERERAVGIGAMG